jgi:hypothetical protein
VGRRFDVRAQFDSVEEHSAHNISGDISWTLLKILQEISKPEKKN